MRRFSILLVMAMAGILLNWPAATRIGAEEGVSTEGSLLTLGKVVLYKSGIGYFELRGNVPAGQEVPLVFSRKQMNDVLKSLTVLNLTGGGIGSVVYDSQRTVAQEMGDYAFEFKKGGGLPQVLEQLQGCTVELNTGHTTVQGTLIGVERRTTLHREIQVPSFHVTVLDSGGLLRSFQTDEITGIRLLDKKLNLEMERHLEALGRKLRRDEKTLLITPTGKGMQDLLVGYVAEAPVWKATYRIVLPDGNEGARPFLQGWAIVDNVTGMDWKEVELCLVSGLPVSFIQNLYDPQYIQRPEVGMEMETPAAPAMPETGVQGERKMVAPGLMPKAKVKQDTSFAADRGTEGVQRDSVRFDERMRDLKEAAAAREVGEMVEYRIAHPVTIKRNRSALVPIVAKEVEAEAVDLYNEGLRPDNPLAAVRLKNTTGLTLEGGPVTVLQGDTYAGEALTATLKPNEERYIAYAVDLGIHVHTKIGTRTEEVDRVVIRRGVLRMHHAILETKTYTLDNKSPRVKRVVIDHPYHADWKLLNAEKPIETTDHYLRFEVTAPPLKATPFTVKEMRDNWETIMVSSLTPDQIVLFAGRRYLDQKTRKQLERIVTLKSEIGAIDRDLKALEKGRDQIFKDQKRLRDNLQGLGQTAEEKDLRSRYIQQLNQQETYLEKERGREKALQDQMEVKQKELDGLMEELEQDLDVGK